MATVKKPAAPLFRVGDWVALLYGPRRVLAQIIEDRGPLGAGGRRLYRIRLDIGFGQSTEFELREEYLEATTEAERVLWEKSGSTGVHQTVAFDGTGGDRNGSLKSGYYYLIVARPGTQAGSGVASIMTLSEIRGAGLAPGPSHTIVTPNGGPDAALAKAEVFLESQHPGLKKEVGEKRP